MSSDLENDNVVRTKRVRHCESRVIPALHMGGFSGLFAYRLCYSSGITALYAVKKSVKQCPW
jgi:hypothetical protein